jgi:hypothetical protein
VKIKILVEKVKGYDNPAYSWECPLCTWPLRPDLNRDFVEVNAKNHLISYHRVWASLISFGTRGGRP